MGAELDVASTDKPTEKVQFTLDQCFALYLLDKHQTPD